MDQPFTPGDFKGLRHLRQNHSSSSFANRPDLRRSRRLEPSISSILTTRPSTVPVP